MDFNKLKKEALASEIKEIEVYQVKGDGALVSSFNTEVDDNSCYFTDELYIRGVYNNPNTLYTYPVLSNRYRSDNLFHCPIPSIHGNRTFSDYPQ